MIFDHRQAPRRETKPCPNMGGPCFCTGVCQEPVGAPPPMRTWVDPDEADNEDYRGDR